MESSHQTFNKFNSKTSLVIKNFLPKVQTSLTPRNL